MGIKQLLEIHDTLCSAHSLVWDAIKDEEPSSQDFKDGMELMLSIKVSIDTAYLAIKGLRP